LCTDERFLAHVPPSAHPESPARLVAIIEALDAAGLRARMTPSLVRPATRGELERVHDAAYLDELEQVVGHGSSDGSGWLDGDTFFSRGTWQAALLAAGGCVDLALAIARGTFDNGLALVRPPGHHATRRRAMGFCLLNNVAVAAAALEAEGSRVAIFDWDVHHGNGTEEIFDADPKVWYGSTHEWPHYPGTGPAHHTGVGEGKGTKLNVPLRRGTDHAAYLEAYDRWVRPAIEAFRPDVILVSAGFDGHRDDPLGGLQLTEETYRVVLTHLLGVQSRLLLVLEGGYELGALGRSVVACARLLVGDSA
jgi:acetoin utilization deacetylase AcuC-like enzyme